MRALHPVGKNEKFVASGVYIHMKDDSPTGSVEHWSIHELPDEARLIRVDDDWRERDGSSVLIEAWCSPEASGGHIERFDVRAFGPKDNPIRDVRTKFTLIDNDLQVGRTVNQGERQQFEFTLRHPYIIAPESLIFGGFEVSILATHPGNPMSVVSYLPAFLTEAATFHPFMYEQMAQLTGEESLQIGQKIYETRKFVQGDLLNTSALHIWIDRHDILIKYISEDGHYSAILTQYARRPT